MTDINRGASPYHAIKAIYCYDSKAQKLLATHGRCTAQLQEDWLSIRTQVKTRTPTSRSLSSGHEIQTADIEMGCLEFPQLLNGHSHHIQEMYDESKGCYVGLLSCRNLSDDRMQGFQDWIETFILLETTLRPAFDFASHSVPDPESKPYRTTEAITSLFESTIRNIPSMDEWFSSGRLHFFQTVYSFVETNARIEFALPAFPCKSPNPKKVGGKGPDMAERIALATLRTFVREIEDIYKPGSTVWIVSDGLVFSDCIGVDDQSCDKYDANLQKIYHALYPSPADQQAIRFRNLTDIFFSPATTPSPMDSFSYMWAYKMDLAHPVPSHITSAAETARKIMMAGFSPARTHLKKLITDQNPSVLSLYRGQSRFMLDDLTFLNNDTTKSKPLSIKQKKKLASEVAFEMILRNSAYSNLVELLLPNFVRLSIHAHSNAGPKFGIRILPSDTVRPISNLDKRHEVMPEYEFQVPTPWHNAMMRVEGEGEKSMWYLGKADIVNQAIEEGVYEGDWVPASAIGEGGYFSIKKKLQPPNMESLSQTPVAKAEAVTDPIPIPITVRQDEQKDTCVTDVVEVENHVQEPTTVSTRMEKEAWHTWWDFPLISFSFQFSFLGHLFRVRSKGNA